MQQLSVLDMAKRFTENPLLIPASVTPSVPGMKVEFLLNPGVFKFEKKVWLLVSVAERPVQKEGFISIPVLDEEGDLDVLHFDKSDPELDITDPRVIHYKNKDYSTTLSHLRLMCSEDGIEFYAPENYHPIAGIGPLETYGIEDCRVTEINRVYYLTYTMVSPLGVGVGLMQTRDWKRFERKGMIFPPHNKNCAIFEEKIGEKYYALHRPSSSQFGGNYIWLAESPDLIHWGNHKCIATTRPGMWDSELIGAGCSPIETPRGWLVIYHGADENHRYCLGALLLDKKNLSEVLARSEHPIMEPTEDYERNGFFGNVISTNGHLVNGDHIRLYYSAGDGLICGAEISMKDIFNALEKS